MKLWGSALLLGCSVPAFSQGLPPTASFPLAQDSITLQRHVEAGKPFTVAGARGVVLGQQEGTFEQWVLPVKVLSHLTIEANVAGYNVPIDVNRDAAQIEVSPDHTVITYAHIAFTLRQTMYSPDEGPSGTGAVVLFQVDSTRPMDFVFRWTPEMRPMWPERGYGAVGPEWDAAGFYVLHTDFPQLAGAIAMPGAMPGIMAPYQEKPQVHPLEFKLHYDPTRDRDKFFPLLVAVGESTATATNAALGAKLAELNAGLRDSWMRHAERYVGIAKELTSIETPDSELNADFRWAEVSIEQLKARARNGETGLVAGYYSSGDSARPGFGWYFGRDTLYTVPALDAVGDFGLSRTALEFLIKRQRADGKMPHEYSQTAGQVDWAAFPYLYESADGTPLFLMAMLDYVRASGDVAFLRAHRAEVEKAWTFETTHDADGDGIYDNAQGTGWVESWRTTGMPKQEIYLALLDRQASTDYAELAKIFGNGAGAKTAAERGAKIAGVIEREYYMPGADAYGFSWDGAAGLDKAATVYPALAWWDGGAGLTHAEASLRRWNSHDFATDWGLRDVAKSDPLYDPISYHQGSVWPLFTGWASVAEYCGGHPLAGYARLRENADLTDAQDLGAVTELLSGAYFAPFGRSTSHQLWSSAMVITPVLKGLFGITVDGVAGTVAVTPNLPATWDRAAVTRLHVGAKVVDLKFERVGAEMRVRVAGQGVRLVSAGRMVVQVDGQTGVLPLPQVEVELLRERPTPGSRTRLSKVLSEDLGSHTLRLQLEGLGGSSALFNIRQNGPVSKVSVAGGQLSGDGRTLSIPFPTGAGYEVVTAMLSW